MWWIITSSSFDAPLLSILKESGVGPRSGFPENLVVCFTLYFFTLPLLCLLTLSVWHGRWAYDWNLPCKAPGCWGPRLLYASAASPPGCCNSPVGPQDIHKTYFNMSVCLYATSCPKGPLFHADLKLLSSVSQRAPVPFQIDSSRFTKWLASYLPKMWLWD